jgi:hypothetical protein
MATYQRDFRGIMILFCDLYVYRGAERCTFMCSRCPAFRPRQAQHVGKSPHRL